MIEVYTDGAANGDPGLSGAGVYIKQGNEKYEFSFPLGTMSNHQAEFWAVIKALAVCKEHFPNEILSFRSDSKVVVDTIEKAFTKNPVFLPLFEKIMSEAESFPYFFIKWIPEKQNKHADELARKALRMQEE